MAKKVYFPYTGFTKDSMIAMASMSSKGVMIRDNNSAMIINIIEHDERKRAIIMEEVEKIVDACEANSFYQPNWNELLKDEYNDV